MPRLPQFALCLTLLAVLLPGCQSTRDWIGLGPDWVALDAEGRPVTLESMADDLAARDVVFLGEIHDDSVGHALQHDLFALLIERRSDTVLSLEMFERDVQAGLDAYLAGEIDEQTFLADARPWKNYADDYRPLVELAAAHDLPVIAANVPRALARSVSQEGLDAVDGEAFVPADVDHGPGDYRDRFDEAMGGHGGVDDESMQRFFAAQCLKDEAMAESVLAARERVLGAPPPLVVHLCGKFHSDEGLGTVERLLRRRPGLDVGLVTMLHGPREPALVDPEDLQSADYTWMLRP